MTLRDGCQPTAASINKQTQSIPVAYATGICLGRQRLDSAGRQRFSWNDWGGMRSEPDIGLTPEPITAATLTQPILSLLATPALKAGYDSRSGAPIGSILAPGRFAFDAWRRKRAPQWLTCSPASAPA